MMQSGAAAALATAAMAAQLVVEYAKSSRAVCTQCKTKIAKGAVRLGTIVNNKGYSLTKWHHPKCYLSAQIDTKVDCDNLTGHELLQHHVQLGSRSAFDCLLEQGSDQDAFRALTASLTNGESPESRSEKPIKISPGSPSAIFVPEEKDEGLDRVKRAASGEAPESRRNKDIKVTSFPASATSMQEEKDQIVRYNPKLWETTLSAFGPSLLSDIYKGARLPSGWKAFSSVIFNEAEGLEPSEKIAAFDFDGCLANTDVRKSGAHAWSLQFASIPEKLQRVHQDGYKLVIFSNESNIERWSKSRQKAVDSKLGRVEALLKAVKVPMQAFISCGREGSGDACRKPSPGMWHLFERHLNGGVEVDMDRSFYVGDAAGRRGDHSAADLEFAKAVGLKFYVPEEVFT